MRLIDADALIDNKLERMIESFGIDFGRADVSFGINEIENAPTVEAESIRHGHWKAIDRDVQGQYKYQCSKCGGTKWAFVSSDYCENCGAKMDEKEEML